MNREQGLICQVSPAIVIVCLFTVLAILLSIKRGIERAQTQNLFTFNATLVTTAMITTCVGLDVGTLNLGWVMLGQVRFGWICWAPKFLASLEFDVKCNFRHVTSKKKCLLTPLGLFNKQELVWVNYRYHFPVSFLYFFSQNACI